MTAMISAVMIAGHHDNMFHITLCLTAPSDPKGQIYGHDLICQKCCTVFVSKGQIFEAANSPAYCFRTSAYIVVTALYPTNRLAKLANDLLLSDKSCGDSR